MKIVVDTNILFSGMLNSTSKIGQILLGSKGVFEFYSCNFLFIELMKHKNKLLSLTKLSEVDLVELQNKLSQNITFINELLIPKEIYKSSELLLEGIDTKDTPYVALATHIKALLWTGDMKLISGLKRKTYNNVISTFELILLSSGIPKE